MDTILWLNKLISFNTISTNSNRQLIETIEDWFKSHDIHTHLIRGSTDEKYNLLATIPANNGETHGGLLLSGHTDVVPVAGQIWETDPFVATEKQGEIYGRGACDMKGFIAVLLALLPEFKKLTLEKPIHFAFTCDEEIGCLGVEFLMKYLQKIGIQPEACIVGEPTEMRPIVGEKGRQTYHCQVQGRADHSSRAAQGCNAIEYASRLISYISNMANYIKENGPFDTDFDFPFPTITTNIISGGSASNIIPNSCEFIFEIRYPPNFSTEHFRSQIENHITDKLLPEMRINYSKAAIYLERTSDASGFNASEDSPILRLARTVTGIEERYKVSYSTEAKIYQDAHIPTIVCGPGNIAQAHQANEYISINQLNLCERVFQNIVKLFCSDLLYQKPN